MASHADRHGNGDTDDEHIAENKQTGVGLHDLGPARRANLSVGLFLRQYGCGAMVHKRLGMENRQDRQIAAGFPAALVMPEVKGPPKGPCLRHGTGYRKIRGGSWL